MQTKDLNVLGWINRFFFVSSLLQWDYSGWSLGSQRRNEEVKKTSNTESRQDELKEVFKKRQGLIHSGLRSYHEFHSFAGVWVALLFVGLPVTHFYK